MPRPLRSILLALTVIVHHPVFAGDIPLLSKALVGKYGFDWLHPENATCTRVSEPEIKTFKTCAPATTGSFTGKTGHVVCQRKDGEFLIYETKTQCQEELETMQANAP
jgi:hypothetical protein